MHHIRLFCMTENDDWRLHIANHEAKALMNDLCHYISFYGLPELWISF